VLPPSFETLASQAPQDEDLQKEKPGRNIGRVLKNQIDLRRLDQLQT
jgi:hypothetical protein